MKKLVYLLCAALPLGAMAQNDSEEKITRVEITIEKDGETKTITRELKDGDYDANLRVYGLSGEQMAFEEMARAKRLMEAEHFFGLEEGEGEEKEVAFLGVIGHTQAIGTAEVVMLDKVIEEKPAASAGLQPGDIVKSIGGKEVASWEALVEEIHARQPGETVKMEVERAGKAMKYDVTLGKQTIRANTKMSWNYEIKDDKPGVSKMRFFYTDDLSDMEKSIIRKKTGVVMNDKNSITDADIDMYPNPTPGKFDYSLKLPEGGALEVILFDTAGNAIEKISQDSSDGTYKGSFDISDKPAGPYMIVFKQDGKALVEKVLKF